MRNICSEIENFSKARKYNNPDEQAKQHAPQQLRDKTVPRPIK